MLRSQGSSHGLTTVATATATATATVTGQIEASYHHDESDDDDDDDVEDEDLEFWGARRADDDDGVQDRCSWQVCVRFVRVKVCMHIVRIYFLR